MRKDDEKKEKPRNELKDNLGTENYTIETIGD